jgi:hypothetical protein
VDYQDIFLFINFHLPAIASRSGEAGGEEIDETQSTSGGNKKLTPKNEKSRWVPRSAFVGFRIAQSN